MAFSLSLKTIQIEYIPKLLSKRKKVTFRRVFLRGESVLLYLQLSGDGNRAVQLDKIESEVQKEESSFFGSFGKRKMEFVKVENFLETSLGISGYILLAFGIVGKLYHTYSSP